MSGKAIQVTERELEDTTHCGNRDTQDGHYLDSLAELPAKFVDFRRFGK